MSTTTEPIHRLQHPLSLPQSRPWWILNQLVLLLGDVAAVAGLSIAFQQGWLDGAGTLSTVLAVAAVIVALAGARGFLRWTMWSHVPGAFGAAGIDDAARPSLVPERIALVLHDLIIFLTGLWVATQPVRAAIPEGASVVGLMGACVLGGSLPLIAGHWTVGPRPSDRLWFLTRAILLVGTGTGWMIYSPTTQARAVCLLFLVAISVLVLIGRFLQSPSVVRQHPERAFRVRWAVAGSLAGCMTLWLVGITHSLSALLVGFAITATWWQSGL